MGILRRVHSGQALLNPPDRNVVKNSEVQVILQTAVNAVAVNSAYMSALFRFKMYAPSLVVTLFVTIMVL